ncbi:hypothetical protein RJ639_040025 [Escallonia herrerae]|uniref:Eukaryotic translation initiation factor 4B3-like n=1 Tax=Escallonia herrerae TaxID=1293975 RepID=A0AA89BD99_9ASTE|nr:hypothetical protein RJ639_040025 [Escallonia herrerae]
MAATVSAWSKPGAWALDSEEHEEELQQTDESTIKPKPAPESDFPSLSAAASTKTKKKKAQTLSLAQFSSMPAPTSQPKGLTPEDLMNLPTGPRQRTAEELDRSKGFRSYGGGDRNGGRYSNGDDESSNSRWGSSRASDESRRPSRDSGPSRADEIDDWGAAKKSTTFGGGFDRRDRGERGGFFDSQSRADESDSWVSNKSFVPSTGARRFGSNGGGFDTQRERRGGFESNGGGGADSEDRWGKKEITGTGGAFDSLRERRVAVGGGGDLDNWKREDGSGSGGGRPRLNLQPRSVAVDQQSETAAAVKLKGSNPFGNARPREENLKEKGQDWKEVDEKIESMKIKEVASARNGSPDGLFGRRSFGSGNGREGLSDDRSERSWRKAVSVDSRPQSAEKTENGFPDAAEVQDPEM